MAAELIYLFQDVQCKYRVDLNKNVWLQLMAGKSVLFRAKTFAVSTCFASEIFGTIIVCTLIVSTLDIQQVISCI